MKKIWYFISILFCLHSISILNEEKDEIIYKLIDREDAYNYLICFDLKKQIKTLSNETTIDLEQFNKNLYVHVTNLEYQVNSIKEYNWKKSEDLDKFNELILNTTKSKSYLILKGQFCLLLKDGNWTFSFIERFFPDKKYFIFKESTFSLIKLEVISIKFDQLVLINNKNCSHNYSKLKCLNECFKRKNRLAKYIYNANESGLIYLDYELNQTIKDSELDCLNNECDKDGCKRVHFESKRVFGKSHTTSVFEATFLLPKLDYYLTIAGLVCLIGNIYLDQLLSILIDLFKSKCEQINGIEKSLKILKIIIISICLSYFVYLIGEFEHISNHRKNSIKTEEKTHSFQPESINLIICINAVSILRQNYREINLKKIILNLTLFKLEKATDQAFNDTFEEIYLKFFNKKVPFKWKTKSNVLFFSSDKHTFLRCFQLKLFPNEPAYFSLLPPSKLVLNFKNYDYSVYRFYLSPENVDFNTETFENSESSIPTKKIIKKSKSNVKEKCSDYDKEYSHCDSKQNCVDRCVNKKFIKKYRNITSYSVIDKQHFTTGQWSTSFLNDDLKKYNEIQKECENEFKNKDCYESKFETDTSTMRLFESNEINLNYEVISQVEEEATFYKLLIDLLNVQSIVLGQNVLKLLLSIYCFLNTKCRLKGSKYYLFFIYLICLSGFIYHIYFIIDKILNGELIHYVYYTVENSIKMTEIIFCFDFKNMIDRNFKLTENYLNQISGEIRKETVFENISYLGKSNQWISLDSNFENSEFRIDTFYLLDLKCFKIRQQIAYARNRFYLLKSTSVLKIKFNKTFIHQEAAFYFTKFKDRMEFSRILSLIFESYSFQFTYVLRQEITRLKRVDKFIMIKSPSLLFHKNNDLNLLLNFELNYNLRTLNLPSENEDLNKEIDNDNLFEQYYNEYGHKSPFNLNFQKLFITTKLKQELRFQNFTEPDFEFKLNFKEDKILITNEDNFTKLILNLLNALSLWTDLCILNLHIYAHQLYCKTKLVFFFSYRQLFRIKIYLYKVI